MTNPNPPDEGSSPDPRSFEEPSIEIFLFRCGHGDTILVRLPDGRWGLIDCFLPDNGVRREFFRFMEDQRVTTLSFIFQTHPHYDHFHGMQALIEYFLQKGERIGFYIDTGLTARRIGALMRNRPGYKEYEALQDKLEEWDESGQLRLGELDAERIPFTPMGLGGTLEFVPIGPDPSVKRRVMTEDLKRIAKNSAARPEANALSLVVVLAARIGERPLNVLLCADADAEGIRRGLDVWNERAREKGITAEFDAVKLPHHGSIKSHEFSLCRAKRPGIGPETATVSAGTRRALPDREVLRDYLQNGWTVMATTTRSRAPVASLPMTLANRGSSGDEEVERHTIRLLWTSSAGLSAEPSAAKITADDLGRYQTASASA